MCLAQFRVDGKRLAKLHNGPVVIAFLRQNDTGTDRAKGQIPFCVSLTNPSSLLQFHFGDDGIALSFGQLSQCIMGFTRIRGKADHFLQSSLLFLKPIHIVQDAAEF